MSSVRKLVVATRNPGKKVEIDQLLAGSPVQLFTLDDFPDAPEVDEDQDTLAGNARKKAVSAYKATGLPALADDTGLEVDALDGRPGVFSARYAGEEGNAVANRTRLKAEMKNVSDRTARFRTVICYVDEQGEQYFEGACSGVILEDERGEGGFGYDPLFLPDGESLTFAELDRESKNAISHRGRALKAFVRFIQDK